MKGIVHMGLWAALLLPGRVTGQVAPEFAPGLVHLASYTPVPDPVVDRDLFFRYRPAPGKNRPATGVPAAFEPPSMPAYTVREPRAQEFRARDLFTDTGMAEFEFQKNPGLHFANFYNSNRALAIHMFLEDDWKAEESDYRDMAHAMSVGGDPAESRQIISQVDDEDLRVKAEEGQTTNTIVTPDMFEVSRMDGDTESLKLPEVPIDVSFVRIRW